MEFSNNIFHYFNNDLKYLANVGAFQRERKKKVLEKASNFSTDFSTIFTAKSVR